MSRWGYGKLSGGSDPEPPSTAPPQAIKMLVVSTPSNDLAVTNFVYCSRSDAIRFHLKGSDHGFVRIGSLVLCIKGHEAVEDGHIGLNLVHRQFLKLSRMEEVSVEKFVPPKGIEIAALTLEVDYALKKRKDQVAIDAVAFGKDVSRKFANQVVTPGQLIITEHAAVSYTITVLDMVLESQPENSSPTNGLLTSKTSFVFESGNVAIKITNQRGSANTQLFKHKELNFQKLGIGGLDAEFADIFRRAFASRVFPTDIINKLGIQHVKGMLLYGPPGTGKTLIARQIGKMLNGREPKVVNGPEVLSKFVGETEKNVRDLFAEAENDQKSRGDQSDLHIIIFDEIDAICKTRGSTRDGTGVHDSIVNQLLTKIDGVEALNNILLIGMTNRKDLLDEALLRPGRLEVQVEIGLPDEKGRCQILQIHTSRMRDNSFLAADVNLDELASRTQNFSGAELEGLVKSAVSFALNRQVDLADLTKPTDEDNIKISMDDFIHALDEVRPAFGAMTSSLERCRVNGMLDCGEKHTHIREVAMDLVEQVKNSRRTPMLTCLLKGPAASGKTSLAATIGLDSGFPFVKIISAEQMVGHSESSKCGEIAKVFEDAYKSPLSIIILDDIERLLEYVNIGPRFSNTVLQTLLVLLKRLPAKGRKLMVIGTTSMPSVLSSMGFSAVFNVQLTVPNLKRADAKKVLQELAVFHSKDIDEAVSALEEEIPIKTLLMLVERAAKERGEGAEDVYAGDRKIDMEWFHKCVADLAGNDSPSLDEPFEHVWS